MNTTKQIAAVLCVTALAVPAAVVAKGPHSHGKSGQAHSQNHVNNRCKHQPKVGFSIVGTLDASSTASAVVVDVQAANKHAKPFVTQGTPDTYAVAAGATLQIEGANPFTTAGVDKAKYRVHVIGKVVKLKKGCSVANSAPPTIKKVIITAP